MTYITFYIENSQWFSSTTEICYQPYYPTTSSLFVNPNIKAKIIPKFEIGDHIVYYTYMLSSNRLTIHEIIGINDSGYIIKSKYGHDDFIIDFDKQDDFMELEECKKTYPDIMLKSKINGPE